MDEKGESDIKESPELNAIVAGLMAFRIQFDGPPTSAIGGIYYQTLCSQGIKAEGAQIKNFGWQDSIEKYGESLASLLKENPDKQIAWRVRPQIIEMGVSQFYVYSRLAFI